MRDNQIMDGKLHGVSFVVTAYNKEAFLEGTLKSVLAQEGDFEREFIVIENGSEDRSGEIADDLVASLPNGRVIRLTPNQGPAIAQINLGRMKVKNQKAQE